MAAAKADLGDVVTRDERLVMIGGAATLAESLVRHPKTAEALAVPPNALVAPRTVGRIVGSLLPSYRDLFPDDGQFTIRTRRGR